MLLDRLGEGLEIDMLAHFDQGGRSSQADRGLLDPFLAAQHPFDPDRARGTRHPIDIEKDRVGLPAGGDQPKTA